MQNKLSGKNLESFLKKIFHNKRVTGIFVSNYDMKDLYFKKSLIYGINKKLLKKNNPYETRFQNSENPKYLPKTYILTSKGKKYLGFKQ